MSLFRPLALSLLLASAATLAQTPPKVVKKVPPEFPAEAVRKNINAGSVKAKLTIGADGKVISVDILEGRPQARVRPRVDRRVDGVALRTRCRQADARGQARVPQRRAISR